MRHRITIILYRYIIYTLFIVSRDSACGPIKANGRRLEGEWEEAEGGERTIVRAFLSIELSDKKAFELKL